jgi:hypothetical protein
MTGMASLPWEMRGQGCHPFPRKKLAEGYTPPVALDLAKVGRGWGIGRCDEGGLVEG